MPIFKHFGSDPRLDHHPLSSVSYFLRTSNRESSGSHKQRTRVWCEKLFLPSHEKTSTKEHVKKKTTGTDMANLGKSIFFFMEWQSMFPLGHSLLSKNASVVRDFTAKINICHNQYRNGKYLGNRCSECIFAKPRKTLFETWTFLLKRESYQMVSSTVRHTWMDDGDDGMMDGIVRIKI